MKKLNYFLYWSLSLILGLSFVSCNNNSSSNLSEHKKLAIVEPPIAPYVVETYEDKKGNLWFGTMSRGAIRYDGQTLTALTTQDGLNGNTVSHILEDKEGNIWLGTHTGLSKYDGKKITNFDREGRLSGNRISTILIDRKGIFWIGTWDGVCQFDGEKFIDFPLPKPAIQVPTYQATTLWVTQIMEDKEGNIWFARSGFGLCKYDGKTFTNYSTEDGLNSNCVQTIIEDQQGDLWIGTRVMEKDHPEENQRKGEGGLIRYDGEKFIPYPEIEGLSQNDIYSIYEDKKGNIWIGANGFGVYQYDGKTFQLYTATPSLDASRNIGGYQSFLEDKNGILWVGCSGGLFRIKNTSLIHVSANGPWK